MKKEIPKKNYVFAILIVLATILIAFYLTKWYKVAKEFYIEKSPLLDIIQEIKIDSLDNYAIENSKFILIITSNTNQDTLETEKKLKKIIKEIKNETILFIDKDILTEKDYKLLNNYLSLENQNKLITENHLFNIVQIEDQKIITLLSINNNKNAYNQIKEYLTKIIIQEE